MNQYTKPYRDPDVLEELYVEQGKTTNEIADHLGVGQSTISRWLNRHGIDRDKPHRNPETLRGLYYDEGLSLREVADRLGVSKEPVARAMTDFDIPTRRPSRERSPTFETTKAGYETWRHQIDGEQYGVYVHRLVAVAEHGFEAVAGNDVHHVSGVPWDNRPSNVRPIDHDDHTSNHHAGRNTTHGNEPTNRFE